MSPWSPLPPSVLVALGLTDTGLLDTSAPTAETATSPTGQGTADTGPAEPPQTGETADTGERLGTGDTGMYKACLCGCDGLEGSVGLNLVLPGLAVLAYRRRSRREILSVLTDTGALPPDVACRLREREG